MIGHLYTLLFIGGEAPAAAPPASGGWTWNPPEPWRRKGEPKAVDAPAPVEPEPTKVERLKLPETRISPAVSAYLDSLQARIAQAAREQELARRTIEAARAEAELEAARAELAAAMEAERIARQQIRDIDIAFVMAVLAEV